MKHRRFWQVLLVLVPGLAFAQEIRVLDPRGLTRAVQSSGEPLTVEVTVTSIKESRLGGAALVQTSGLADDRVVAGSGSEYVFIGVPPGTWQVKLNDSSEQINRVRILK